MTLKERTSALLLVETPSTEDYVELSQLIRALNHKYYVESESAIEDALYDVLLKTLIEWEGILDLPDNLLINSPSQKLTENSSDSFKKVKHQYPMLSLSNAFDDSDLLSFVESVGANEAGFVIEPKFDGVSIAIHYENDAFVQAITRGNGEEGEDVTQNVRTISNLPLLLPLSKYGIRRAEFRGEIYISKSAFARFNQLRVDRGMDPFQNSRNTASGSLRLKEIEAVRERPLEVVLFHCVHCDNGDPATQLDKEHNKQMLMLNHIGLPTTHPFLKQGKGLNGVVEAVTFWEGHRKNFPIEIDGLVIKVNDTSLHDSIGSTGHHPKWATAFKFTAENAESTLLDVEFQVGRTGVLTPVAKIKPVPLHGVIIRNISLHNQDFIERLDLHIGDTVQVVRAGDVIPYVKEASPPSSGLRGERVTFPRHCPACQTLVVREKESAVWLCPNGKCPAKELESLQYFVSKAALDVDGFGKEVMRRFYDLGFVQQRVDIFNLHTKRKELVGLEGLGEKSIDNLLSSIEQTRKQSLWRQIVSLGIPLVGPQTAKSMVRELRLSSLAGLLHVSSDLLMEIDDIGEKVCASILSFTQDPRVINEVSELSQCFEEQKETSNPDFVSSGPLASQRVVVTGGFSFASREEIKGFIEELGGVVSSSVSKKTSFIIVGEKPGSKKEKAQKLGVPIMENASFLSWYNGGQVPEIVKTVGNE